MPLAVSRALRPFDQRQRFDVERDRGAIVRRKFRRIGDHCRHRATDRIAVGHVAALEDSFDVALGIIADSCWRDIGDGAVAAFRIGTAGKALACDDAAEGVARAVALRAMARAADQISAPIPLGRLGWIGTYLRVGEIKTLPAPEPEAD